MKIDMICLQILIAFIIIKTFLSLVGEFGVLVLIIIIKNIIIIIIKTFLSRVGELGVLVLIGFRFALKNWASVISTYTETNTNTITILRKYI